MTKSNPRHLGHLASSHPRRWFLAWLAAASAEPLWAQTTSGSAAPPAPLATLQGTTLDGQTLSLEALRGQVVLVFFWSTDCAICLNKMPELRINAAGWRGQKFTLLGVNMDKQREAFQRYEEVVVPLLPAEHRFQSVWGNDPRHAHNLGPVDRLPSAVLINAKGQVVERYSGRIPPQAWNRIADLL